MARTLGASQHPSSARSPRGQADDRCRRAERSVSFLLDVWSLEGPNPAAGVYEKRVAGRAARSQTSQSLREQDNVLRHQVAFAIKLQTEHRKLQAKPSAVELERMLGPGTTEIGISGSLISLLSAAHVLHGNQYYALGCICSVEVLPEKRLGGQPGALSHLTVSRKAAAGNVEPFAHASHGQQQPVRFRWRVS